MANWEGVLQTRLKLILAVATTPVFFSSSLIGLEPQKAAAQTTPAAPDFNLPSSLPSGTTLKIDGSSSMEVVDESFKERYQKKFPGTTVDLKKDGTDKALKGVVDGTVDVAAVGRPLTPAEKAQGLVEAPMGRGKVAIIVGPNNPFKKSITFDQFAKIFRGEITDWSQLGGAPGPIRMVDRPDSSDTRLALSQYTVFQGSPFETGANAIQVEEDSTEAVIKELGNDGISYAIADQVVDQSTVKVLPLHETLPNDPRYPFSQHRGYVYKGEPNPATQAFLGIAVSRPGQEAVAVPRLTASPALEPSATVSAAVEPTAETQASAPSTPVDTETRSFPWGWLLLPLLGLGGLLAAMRGRSTVVPAAVPIAAVDSDRSRIILTPRDCRNAYAYWEMSDKDKEAFRSQSGRNLALRLQDVTDIDLNRQAAHSVKQFDVRENEPDHHLPIALDDRDYAVELGYETANGEWVKVARSEAVRVPACTPAEKIGTAATAAAGGSTITPTLTPGAIAAGAGAAALAGVALAGRSTAHAASAAGRSIAPDPDRIILVPRDAHSAYAYWEVAEERQAALKQQGGENLTLRVHDVTDIDFDHHPAHNTQEYGCSELDRDQHIPISKSDRDYVADLGYLTQDNRWLRLAQSDVIRVPSDQVALKPAALSAAAAAATSTKLSDITLNRAAPTQDGDSNQFSQSDNAVGASKPVSNLVDSATQAASNLTQDAGHRAGSVLAGGTAAVAGMGAMAKSFLEKGASSVEGDRAESETAAFAPDCRIILASRTSNQAYAYWEVAHSYKEPLRQEGGKRLTLRIHDVTNIDIDHQPPHSTQEYPCLETDHDKHVPISAEGSFADLGYRDYLAELGYLTDDNRWLKIIRSLHVRIPQNG